MKRKSDLGKKYPESRYVFFYDTIGGGLPLITSIMLFRPKVILKIEEKTILIIQGLNSKYKFNEDSIKGTLIDEALSLFPWIKNMELILKYYE